MKLLWAAYLVVTSVYCLLAFVPYTYLALVKAPPYAWIPWFVQHHAALFWLQIAVSMFAFYQRELRTAMALVCAAEIALAVYLTKTSMLASLQSNFAAFFWSLCFLFIAVIFAALASSAHLRQKKTPGEASSLLAWPGFVLTGTIIAAAAIAGGLLLNYNESGRWQITTRDLEFSGWSLVTNVAVALLLFALLNLAHLGSKKTRHPRLARSLLVGGAGWLVLWFFLAHFLHSALDVHGWSAQTYASALALTLVLIATDIALWLAPRQPLKHGFTPWKAVCWIGLATLIAAAVFLPSFLEGGDWNGILQSTFVLFMWCALAAGIYYLLPLRANYSVPGLLAVLILTVFTYEGLAASEVIWARKLGNTEEEISASLDGYAGQDASFAVTRRLLGGVREQECDELCGIMRQYTNVRYGLNPDVHLVENLAAAPGKLPNIFIFVVDSLRPDYLGAYNPRVDFTPNLDAFGKDGVVLHKVFTQYSGTSLSEPAIWSGIELLHTHQLQPFAKINGLEKLAHADHYHMIVSYDDIIKELLVPSGDLTKLDTDKTVWNSLEVCTTIQELEHHLDHTSNSAPELFYTQPKNVHQFARNDVPAPTQANWRPREGMNNRIAYATHYVDGCMGGFFSYLKEKGLFDTSIIIFTADHGDATGEFGRKGHGNTIYPEVLHVPLIVHLPRAMRQRVLFDDATRLSTLTDITPSLYYLLGHRPVVSNPLFGKPIFVGSPAEIQKYGRKELYVAADITGVFGILDQNGRYLYVRNDSPPQSLLFDLASDPNALHNILTDGLKRRYDDRVVEHWSTIAAFYGFKGAREPLLASAK
ncbi:MAG TPA: sulfatase-like hydrolase/transferase [Terriglobales bacterium]|nr:sulfatase-like hydrolase/transferase [Terriglobales bacterium]